MLHLINQVGEKLKVVVKFAICTLGVTILLLSNTIVLVYDPAACVKLDLESNASEPNITQKNTCDSIKPE